MNKSRSAKWQRRLIQPPRAVIDIGSNTVRMVIYEGTGRAPEVVWNEKVAARLGRDLSNSGRIPKEAWDEALAALGDEHHKRKRAAEIRKYEVHARYVHSGEAERRLRAACANAMERGLLTCSFRNQQPS